MAKGIYGEAAVAGIGMLQYKRGQSPHSERKTLVQAIVKACEDAGLHPSEVDGFVSYGDDRSNEPPRLMPELGTKELHFSTQVWSAGGGGLLGAFELAAMAITTGHAKAVVVFRALVEGSTGRLATAVSEHHVNQHYAGVGMMAIAPLFAIRARRLAKQCPFIPAAVEALVQADYYHAGRNPEALAYGKAFSIEDYRQSRWIAEPFHLYDCSRESDGAAAVLLVSAEHAKDLQRKPTYLLGANFGAPAGWGDLLENDKDFSSNGFGVTAARLWEQTRLSPKDIDVTQIYENFSYQSVLALIEFGLTSYEAAAEDISFENLIAPSGKMPVNTAGGNLAGGFIHGMDVVIEAIRQLRGESANPVPDAKTCLVTGGPGAPSSSAIFATEIP